MSFTHYGHLYGANRSLLTLVTALKDQIDWLIICKEKSEFTEELTKHNISYRIAPFTNDVYNVRKNFQAYHSLKRSVYNMAWAFYLSFLVRRERFDVIHTNSSVIFIGAMVAFFSGRKHLWHIREFVYEDYKLRYFLGKRAYRFWANRAEKILCISSSIQKKRVIAENITAKSEVIYNGLVEGNLNVFPKSIINTVPVIGIVGVIDPAKEQLTAIKALNAVLKSGRQMMLRIVGDVSSNDYFRELTDYVEKEKLSEHVIFAGFSKDIPSIFRDLDISLMCAKNEGLGRVTIESLMYGVPVIAFESAGTMEIVQNGQTGLLYSGDAEDLASQIRRLADDTDLYKQLSANGIEHVKETFTIATYARKFFDEVILCVR